MPIPLLDPNPISPAPIGAEPTALPARLSEPMSELGELVRRLSGIDLAATEWAMAAIGMALLIFGRRLYWLGVGALGFVSALYLSQLLPLPDTQTRLILGVIAGIAGVILALTVQKIAIAAAGFVLGSLASLAVLPWIWPEAGLIAIAVALVGGLVGLLLARPFFDFVLILASSVAGGILIAQLFGASPGREAALVLILALIGLVIQLKDGKEEDDDD